MRLKIVLLMTVRIGKLVMTEFACLRLGMITFKEMLKVQKWKVIFSKICVVCKGIDLLCFDIEKHSSA